MSCGQNTRRRILAAAIGQILKEYGYEAVKKDCLETLIEMMTACKLSNALFQFQF